MQTPPKVVCASLLNPSINSLSNLRFTSFSYVEFAISSQSTCWYNGDERYKSLADINCGRGSEIGLSRE